MVSAVSGQPSRSVSTISCCCFAIKALRSATSCSASSSKKATSLG